MSAAAGVRPRTPRSPPPASPIPDANPIYHFITTKTPDTQPLDSSCCICHPDVLLSAIALVPLLFLGNAPSTLMSDVAENCNTTGSHWRLVQKKKNWVAAALIVRAKYKVLMGIQQQLVPSDLLFTVNSRTDIYVKDPFWGKIQVVHFPWDPYINKNAQPQKKAFFLRDKIP
jgi:hypothetical protein